MNNMLLKWAIWGFVIGAVVGIFSGGFLELGILGAVAGVALRKWVFRTLWM